MKLIKYITTITALYAIFLVNAKTTGSRSTTQTQRSDYQQPRYQEEEQPTKKEKPTAGKNLLSHINSFDGLLNWVKTTPLWTKHNDFDDQLIQHLQLQSIKLGLSPHQFSILLAVAMACHAQFPSLSRDEIIKQLDHINRSMEKSVNAFKKALLSPQQF